MENRHFGVITAKLDPEEKTAELDLRRYGFDGFYRLPDYTIMAIVENWAKPALERDGYQVST